MSMTDPIADMLTRLRNAVGARHAVVEMPSSAMKAAIARALRAEGFIKDFEVRSDGPRRTLRIQLLYSDRKQPVLTGLRRISKPGRRMYCSSLRIPRVYEGVGVCILSTPKGVVTGDEARRLKVGGEILCYVW